MILATSLFAQDTTEQINPLTKNDPSQYKKPYVILISADGFRADFAEKYDATFLQTISQNGVRAKYMQPSYPSVTFPNHYTIVTGLYPAHHGLVDNTYIDVASGQQYSMANKKMVSEGKWYGGTPLWVLAEQQKMLSASFFWVASEADIQGIKPTYHYIYNEKTNIGTRIQAVKNWLMLPEDRRPHMITFYFPDVDHDAHTLSEPKTTFKDWMSQKYRHYTTSKFYKKKHVFLLGLYSMSQFLVYPALIVALVFTKEYVIILSIWGFRAILQGLILRGTMKKLNELDLWPWYILFDIWSIFYYLITLPSVWKSPQKNWN